MSKVGENMEKSDNVIFVGKKPIMAYVLAVVTQLNSGKDEVHVKARGQSISKAVDVVEIVKNKFMPDVKVASIDIGTDVLEVEKDTINVSRIDIIIKK